MEELSRLTLPELRHIVWEQLGIRAPLTTPPIKLHNLLDYTIAAEDLASGLINSMRDKITEYILGHEGRLSLPCHGQCYEHSDGVVLNCYIELVRELANATTDEEAT